MKVRCVFVWFLCMGVSFGSFVGCSRICTEPGASEASADLGGSDVVSATARGRDGRVMQMRFDNGKGRATLVLDGQTLELQRKKAASGIWYANDHYELRGKGPLVELRKDGTLIFEGVEEVLDVRSLPVEGTAWQLVSYQGPDDAMLPALSVAPPTLSLHEGQTSGFAGCNRFFGQYQLEDGRLTFGPLAATLMAGSPEQAKQESAYLKLLAEVQRYEQDDGHLRLYGGGNRLLLVFKPEVGS
jgi:heat shock protein HslJ